MKRTIRQTPRRAVRLAGALLTCALAWACADPQGDFERASELDTVAAYRGFVEAHPDSPLARRARQRLEVLKAWAVAQSRGDVRSLEAFLDEHPGTDFEAEARAALETARARHRRRCGEGRPYVLDAAPLVDLIDESTLDPPNKVRLDPSGPQVIPDTGPGGSYSLVMVPAIQLRLESTLYYSGTEITFEGAVEIAPGYLFESSPRDELVFRLDVRRGWVYLGGTGKITHGDQTLVTLPDYTPYPGSGETALEAGRTTAGERRALALWALGCLRPEGAGEVLDEALAATDWFVRRQAARAARWLGTREVEPALRALLEDEDRAVRRAAAQALGRLDERTSMPAVREAYERDPDLWVRIRAAEALVRLGAEGFPARLASLLDSNDRDERFLAAHALQLVDDDAIRERLEQARQREEDAFVAKVLGAPKKVPAVAPAELD